MLEGFPPHAFIPYPPCGVILVLTSSNNVINLSLSLQRWGGDAYVDEYSGGKASKVQAVLEHHKAQLTMNAIQLAAKGDLQQLRVMRKSGADFMLADYDGRTALHLAAGRGFYEICSFIVQEGADVSRRGEKNL